MYWNVTHLANKSNANAFEQRVTTALESPNNSTLLVICFSHLSKYIRARCASRLPTSSNYQTIT